MKEVLMHLHCLVLSLIITLFCTSTTLAKDLMDPVIVTATKFKTKETKATFASEVYTREDIEQSGVTSIYDFLNQHTSTSVITNYGNKFNQLIDIRGFGLTDGYKNIVVSVNGRRLNNLDSIPTKLSDIGVNNIDRIEITRGSGSVIYGDAATAGTIQIYTRDTTQTTIESSVGNYGINTGSFTTGFSEDNFLMSVSGSHYQQGGFAQPDFSEIKDRASSKNYDIKLKYFPTEASEIFIENNHSHINTRYQQPISQGDYDSNPGSSFKTQVSSTSGHKLYPFETSNTNDWNIGGNLEVTDNLEFNLAYYHQDKVIKLDTHKQYHTNAIDTGFKFTRGPARLVGGINSWTGARRADMWNDGDQTAKKSHLGYFLQSYFDVENTVYSLGLRREVVEYSWKSDVGEDIFYAYDLGINKTLSDQLSVFSNFNYAFASPEVDRFFSSDGTFNGFIVPARTYTINAGLNHVTSKNKLKATVYGMQLRNELYYNGKTFDNTNLHKSYKYGIELQNTYNFNDALFATINYAYTQAIIEHLDGGAQSTKLNCIDFCKGNELPGVSDHIVTFGINYKPTQKTKLTLGQTYRSEFYKLEDFANNFTRKNAAFTSTDVSYRYIHKIASGKSLFEWWGGGPSQIELVAKIDNLFEQSNYISTKADVIYPTNYTRNMSIGTNIKF